VRIKEIEGSKKEKNDGEERGEEDKWSI